MAAALCWLGVGLWLLAHPPRAARALPASAPAALARLRALTPARARALRLLGIALLLAASLPLSRELGAALAGVGLIVLAMTALSLAVILFPLRPRLYAASLPVALLAAAAAGALR